VALCEGGAQGILVASEEPLVASRAELARRDQVPAIRETLDGRSLESLFDELLLSDDDLHKLTEEVAAANDGPIISHDDNLFLEYATPKGNVLNYDASLAECMAMLQRYTADVRQKHLGIGSSGGRGGGVASVDTEETIGWPRFRASARRTA
jgi:spermidine synthase